MKKMNVNSPEYRALVSSLLGKEVRFQDVPQIEIRKSPAILSASSSPLSSPLSVEKLAKNQEMIRIGITGDKNTDFIVLSNLNDYDLARVCRVNKYTRDLCQNENFWMNRTIKRFSQFSSDINADRIKLNLSWKKFYVKLVDILEWLYSNRDIRSLFSGGGPPGRRRQIEIPQIFLNISKLVEDQTDQFENAIINKDFNKAREILNRDFVNPNRFFSEEGMGRDQEIKSDDKVLNIITKDERFKPTVILANSFDFAIEQTHLLMKYILPLLTWKQILDAVFNAVSNDISLDKPSLYLKYAVSMGAKKSDIKKYLDNVDIISKSSDSDGHHFQKQKLKDIKNFLSKMK